MTINDLFDRDPTRQLEEVQKVNAHERAENDVKEFYETDSAEQVLRELGETIESPGSARFLYIHATFGSGKTHLLKLVGLVTDDRSEFSYLGDRLVQTESGFKQLSESIDSSSVDRLKPVFLNLLDRDASKDPPLPFLVFQAIGRELGYPTEPSWMLEWAWKLDMDHSEIWDALQRFEHDGKTFEDVIDERALLRSWLYTALPAIQETSGTKYASRSGVKDSIKEAEKSIEPEEFGPGNLASRVESVTDRISEAGERAELLLGLDEVALFVGDSRHRYQEFEDTMVALQRGPNPVVVTTGQYSLPDTRESLIGESSKNHWTNQQVQLEGADTEIIVRKRWLKKQDPEGRETVESLVNSMPDLSLETRSSITGADPDPVESYPFREYDLSLLREAMQELITQGRSTDREYIQGRALLILVRSLFTKFGWASKDEGSLVTWDTMFDLLAEETTYLPLWVQEMIDNTLIPTFGGDEDAWSVRLAKGLYLLNQVPSVPSTPENLGRLMIDDVSVSVDEVVERTESGLQELVDKQKVLVKTDSEGNDVYNLVSEEQESVLSRAQDRAAQVSQHQLSAWVEERLRENDQFFRSDGSRHEVDVGGERLVPLRYEYSVLEPVDRAPSPEQDAVRVRVLADKSETVSEQIDTWQEVNADRGGGEHILVTVDVPETMLEQIRNVIGKGQVLQEETEAHEELETEHRKDKRRLESLVTDVLDDASVYTVSEHRGSRSSMLSEVVVDQVNSVFGSSRRTLSRPLREVEDAKALSKFFRGSGEWPLAEEDAATLGVDTDSAELTESGWCSGFIDTYEDQKSVGVETLLQKTRSPGSDIYGTPLNSVAALLMTVATSNKSAVLRQDGENVTEASEIGRKVRTKGGLRSLQVRFDEVILDPKAVGELVASVTNEEPKSGTPEEWLEGLGSWVDANSKDVRRVLTMCERKFDVSLDLLESVIEPGYSGQAASLDSGIKNEIGAVLSQAETFADAYELFVADEDAQTIWGRFESELDVMNSLYPDSSVAVSMQATADSSTVPSVSTVNSRIEEAEEHRISQVSAQYCRITGEEPADSGVESICDDLTEWLRSNESNVDEVLNSATQEFDDIKLGEFREMCDSVWNGEDLSEADIARSQIVQQAETYQQVRVLFDDTSGESLWSQLEAAAERLQGDHPRSPTTETVRKAVESDRPPSEGYVERLVDRAEDPRPPDADDDSWAELQTIEENLSQEVPNADITDQVTAAIEADERPDEERVMELISESKTVLRRIGDLKQKISDTDSEIVLIET